MISFNGEPSFAAVAFPAVVLGPSARGRGGDGRELAAVTAGDDLYILTIISMTELPIMLFVAATGE